jgi:hypothetical protein
MGFTHGCVLTLGGDGGGGVRVLGIVRVAEDKERVGIGLSEPEMYGGGLRCRLVCLSGLGEGFSMKVGLLIVAEDEDVGITIPNLQPFHRSKWGLRVGRRGVLCQGRWFLCGRLASSLSYDLRGAGLGAKGGNFKAYSFFQTILQGHLSRGEAAAFKF